MTEPKTSITKPPIAARGSATPRAASHGKPMGETSITHDPAVERRESGLTINRARKTFTSAEGKQVKAIDDVSLSINAGEFFIMLGPSGCGKTTLLRSIAGLETLDAGEIYIGDQRIDQLPPYERPVNTVFQSYALFPHMTVAQNIAFGLEMEKKPNAEIRKTVADMLDLVHLGDMGGRRPSQLSGGQQQRIALARALAKKPKVLLLDESLSALDFKLRRQMQTELKRIQRETGITFIFVTHDQEEALSMGDRIAVFHNGRPEQVGTPEEIYDLPVDRFVADFIGDINFLDATKSGPNEVTIAGQVFDADSSVLSHAVGEALTAAVRPERIDVIASDDPQAAARPTLAGTVTDAMFMGFDMRVHITLADGQTLMTRVSPPFDPALIKPSAHVRLVIDGLVRVVE